MTVAIIGCMDRRLNLFFENVRNKVLTENPNENVYIIRDAGGGVSSVGKTILDLNITDIHDYTHTNCGAMRVAMGASLKINSGTKLDEVESSEDVYDTTIAPFIDQTYNTPLEIEKKNTQIQEEMLSHLKLTHPGLKVSCELIDIEKLDVPKVDCEYTLIIGMAYSGKYSEIADKYNLVLSSIYFVQANYIEEIRPAVKLAVEKLNIHNVMFVSNNPSEDSIVEHWSNDPTLKNLFEKYLMKVPLKTQSPRK
jgi:carbonic anhydrase